MAKKKIEQPIDDEQPEYESVEPTSFDTPDDWQIVSGETEPEQIEVTLTKPGGEALPLSRPADEPQYTVTFKLPLGVLVALLDQWHPLADVEGAGRYGLLEIRRGEAIDLYLNTSLGELVLSGMDRTQVYQKMVQYDRLHKGE